MTLPSGDGSTRTPSVLGSTAAGSFRETRISKPRPDASWICTNASGRAVNSAPTSSSYRPTRRPASRRAAEKPASLPPQPRRPMKIEHEYERLGAWAYLAALDVHRAKLFGRCEAKTGIAPFDRLVDQVMKQRPVPPGSKSFLDRRQRLCASGAPRAVRRLQDEVSQPGARSWTRSRQLAEPNRDLFLHRPTKSLDAKRLPFLAAVGSNAYSPSSGTTKLSLNLSSGGSPEKISTHCSANSNLPAQRLPRKYV